MCQQFGHVCNGLYEFACSGFIRVCLSQRISCIPSSSKIPQKLSFSSKSIINCVTGTTAICSRTYSLCNNRHVQSSQIDSQRTRCTLCRMHFIKNSGWNVNRLSRQQQRKNIFQFRGSTENQYWENDCRFTTHVTQSAIKIEFYVSIIITVISRLRLLVSLIPK